MRIQTFNIWSGINESIYSDGALPVSGFCPVCHWRGDFPLDSLTVETDKGQVKLSIEVATTAAQQEQGLMFRKSMPQDHGMLFPSSEPRNVYMWMKNTFIPLDMVFMDAHGIVSNVVKNATPESTRIISSGGPVLAVLEMNGGAADYYHIKNGSRVIYSIFK